MLCRYLFALLLLSFSANSFAEGEVPSTLRIGDIVELDSGEIIEILDKGPYSKDYEQFYVTGEDGRARLEKFPKVPQPKKDSEKELKPLPEPKSNYGSKVSKATTYDYTYTGPQYDYKGKKITEEDSSFSKSSGPKLERIRVERNTIPTGTKIKTPDKKEYTVVRYVDTGRRGVVYKVKDKSGNFYALKIAKDDFVMTLDSIKDEVKKAEPVKELGLRQAEIYEHGKRFVVKEWIEGTRGDVWFQKWAQDGADLEDKRLKKLIGIFEDAAKKGTYVGDLNPKNLVWTEKEWVILESGDSRKDLKPEEALKRFLDKFVDRWGKKIAEGQCKKLCKHLGVKMPDRPYKSSFKKDDDDFID